jgi:hypothetical protein
MATAVAAERFAGSARRKDKWQSFRVHCMPASAAFLRPREHIRVGNRCLPIADNHQLLFNAVPVNEVLLHISEYTTFRELTVEIGIAFSRLHPKSLASPPRPFYQQRKDESGNSLSTVERALPLHLFFSRKRPALEIKRDLLQAECGRPE